MTNGTNPNLNREGRIHVTEDHFAKAALVVEWLRTLNPEDASDYISSLAIIGRVGRVNDETCGIAGSAVVAYDRAMAKACLPEFKGGFVGVKGEKVDLIVTMEDARVVNSAFGSSVMVKMLTAEGARLVAFSTGQDADELLKQHNAGALVGSRRRLFATVKEHKPHAVYGDSTTVTRITVQPEDFVIPVKAKRAAKVKATA